MKHPKRYIQKDIVGKTLLSHIQSELRKLSADDIRKLREDSETNALLVEAIKNSMKGAK